MSKAVLEMTFAKTNDKKVNLSIDNPRSDLTGLEIKTAMDTIVAQNIFDLNGEEIVAPLGARIVTTSVEEIELQ